MSKRNYDKSKKRQLSEPITLSIARFVLGLPRILRIIIAALFGVATTLALFEVVDKIYIEYFFSQSTRILPALISGGFGMAMYVVGWQLIVGIIGEERHAKAATVWYFAVGLFAIFLSGFWFFRVMLVNNGSV